MIEIFNEISKRIIKGIMLHEQMADYFDFLNLQGFKRWAEKQFIEENAELRGVHRYAINHLNRLVNDNTFEQVSFIPSSWYSATKMQVDSSTRKQGVKDAFEKWYNWETETKAFYESKFKILTDNGKIAEANKVNDLIRKVDKELKCVTRKMLELKSVDYDMQYIAYIQQDIHDKYEKELEEVYKVQMC